MSSNFIPVKLSLMTPYEREKVIKDRYFLSLIKYYYIQNLDFQFNQEYL